MPSTLPDSELDEPRAAGAPISSTRLIVFSDDWGRHPSSCQHLIARLLPRYSVTWVNTIGTRAPRLSLEDVGKVAKKLWQWLRPAEKAAAASVGVPRDGSGESALKNLTVVTPRMYPGFRRNWQRRLNAKLIARSVNRALGPRQPGEKRVVITTIPITADLPPQRPTTFSDGACPVPPANGRHADTLASKSSRDHTAASNDEAVHIPAGGLDVDRWIYYCVDDFSVWPGLDGSVMDAMERQLVARADEVLVVSETLRRRIQSMGRDAIVLTHGIDLEHWGRSSELKSEIPDLKSEISNLKSEISDLKSEVSDLRSHLARLPRPLLLFWGVIDPRLDLDWCRALAQAGSLVLLGPQQSPDDALAKLANVHLPGPVPYDDLPALAQAADALVMPYADLPVTRAMQPLKFKEYLATGKPVIVRRLPATEPWADAADVVDSIDALLAAVKERVAGGATAAQLAARQRLFGESWTEKAKVLERAILKA